MTVLVSHNELSQLAGMSRPHVTVTMGRLRRRELVRYGREGAVRVEVASLTEYLGLAPHFVTTVDVGGTVTGMAMLQQAVWAIEAGHCHMAVCVYGDLTGRRLQRGLGSASSLGVDCRPS